MHHAHAWYPWRPEEDVRSSRTVVTVDHVRAENQNQGLLLTAESSLQIALLLVPVFVVVVFVVFVL